MSELSRELENARIYLTKEEDGEIEGFIIVRAQQVGFEGRASDSRSGWDICFTADADEWIEENETDAVGEADLREAMAEVIYESLEYDNLSRSWEFPLETPEAQPDGLRT